MASSFPGPPPIFNLQPPSLLDAATLAYLGITTPLYSCMAANINTSELVVPISPNKNLFTSSSFLLATSLVIAALIILLSLFIIAACLLVRTNRRKLSLATDKINRIYLISNSSASDSSANNSKTTVSYFAFLLKDLEEDYFLYFCYR